MKLLDLFCGDGGAGMNLAALGMNRHEKRLVRQQQERILAALRAELPSLSCYEPSRMIGSPCSCAAGLLRAIEIVEAAQ